jgi:hypothetical protein
VVAVEAGRDSSAPQISQFRSEGWLWKVQRGHVIEFWSTRLLPAWAPLLRVGAVDENVLLEPAAPRLVLAEMAAFSTCGKSGLMPQVRQGGSGNASVAIVGSKLDGTGFGKEQMVQIHVPRSSCGVDARNEASGKGLEDRDTGEDDDASRCTAGVTLCGICVP